MNEKFMFMNTVIEGVSMTIYAKSLEEAWGILDKLVTNRSCWKSYK